MKMSSQRKTYGETLVRIGASDPRLVVLEADLGNSTQSIHFQRAYPDRYFEMGIAEANMTSFAAGLALTGKIAVTNSFAVFAAGRAFDQIRQGVSIPALNVKVVGSSAGLSDFGDGATHQAIDDIAIMRAVPNMTVLVPADAPQTEAMVHWMIAHEGPVYLRICRNDLPEVTGAQPDPTAPAVLREGNDVALAACGVMVFRALQAAERLAEKGISARVINVCNDGARVEILNPGLNWCRVRTSSGETGYMMTRYLTVYGVPGTPIKQVGNKRTFVNFRSTPRIASGNVLAELNAGEEVTVLIPGDEWSKVLWEDQTGYMMSCFLK